MRTEKSNCNDNNVYGPSRLSRGLTSTAAEEIALGLSSVRCTICTYTCGLLPQALTGDVRRPCGHTKLFTIRCSLGGR